MKKSNLGKFLKVKNALSWKPKKKGDGAKVTSSSATSTTDLFSTALAATSTKGRLSTSTAPPGLGRVSSSAASTSSRGRASTSAASTPATDLVSTPPPSAPTQSAPAQGRVSTSAAASTSTTDLVSTPPPSVPAPSTPAPGRVSTPAASTPATGFVSTPTSTTLATGRVSTPTASTPATDLVSTPPPSAPAPAPAPAPAQGRVSTPSPSRPATDLVSAPITSTPVTGRVLTPSPLRPATDVVSTPRPPAPAPPTLAPARVSTPSPWRLATGRISSPIASKSKADLVSAPTVPTRATSRVSTATASTSTTGLVLAPTEPRPATRRISTSTASTSTTGLVLPPAVSTPARGHISTSTASTSTTGLISTPIAPTLATDLVSTPTPSTPASGPAKIPSATTKTALSPPEQIPPSVPQSLTPAAASDVASTPSLDLELWSQAYKIVQRREPELMEDYNTHLTLLQGEAAGHVDLSTPRSVESIMEQLLGDREKKQWRVSLLGNNIKTREQAERLAKFLLWSDPVVKDALHVQPYAALAWSGVSLLLPLLTSNTAQNEAMLKGFNLIGDLQMYWRICEDTFLRPDHRQRYEDIIKPLAGLYSHIIEYQARAICHLSSAQLSRTWQDVTVWNDWDGKAKHIDGQSERCKDYISPLQEREVLERWKCQLQEMQQSRTILQEIYEALEDGGRQTQRHYEDQRERDLLQHLDSDYEDYKNFNPQKVKGTCEWFFNDDRFRKWRDSNKSSLLWVSAGPGCGKSVLSRALIDERRLSTNITTSTVCYFFFKDGDERRMHSTNALCAILHQLLTRDSSGGLIKNALASHRSYGAGLAQNFSELWRIMVGCAGSSDTGEVVVILDALDECEKNSRDQLIDKLKEFYRDQHNLSRSKLKFLITSRPYGDIEKYFGVFPGTNYLRFEGDDKSAEISHEINLVIDERVNQIAGHLAADDRYKLANHLKSMENRTYLWLHLIFDIIEGELSLYTKLPSIEGLLSDIPVRICEAYEKILGRSQDEVQTEMLLRIVLAAGRPLTLNEANFALTLAMKEERFPSRAVLESELWPNQGFKDTVQSLVGPFISIYDSRLYFIHQTAREFLTYSKRHGKWEGRLNTSKSHSTMSLVCLHYLLLPDLGCSPGDKERSFLPYAAAHWPWHYLSQEDVMADKLRKDARVLCHVDGKQVRAWVPWHRWKSTYPFKRIHWSDFGSGFGSDLALASYLGLKWVVEDILAEEKTDINPPRKPGGTALQAASRRGHEEIAQMLLDKNADGNMLNEFEMTALYAASAGGHKEIVRMLLDKTADANTLNDFEMTALYAASAHGHKDIVLMLLDHNKDHGGPRKWNRTPPYAASERGHKETAHVLLNHKADVDMRDGRYMAARAASYNGHKDVARLLDKKANATTPG